MAACCPEDEEVTQGSMAMAEYGSVSAAASFHHVPALTITITIIVTIMMMLETRASQGQVCGEQAMRME